MRQRGLGLGLLSAATFGSSGSFASALIASGWTPGAAVTVRVAVAALLLTPLAVLALRGRWSSLVRGGPRLVLFGVGAVGLAQLCYFNAVQHIPVAVALLLEYSGTVLVVGWMWLRHGHRPGRRTVLGAVLALVGLVLVLDLLSSGASAKLDPVGVLWGLGAAVGLAIYFVLSAGAEDGVPPIAVAWSGLAVGAAGLGVFGAVHALPMAATTAPVTLAGHRVSWLVPVAGLAVVAAAVAYVTGIEAARMLGARLASFVGLAEVLAAVCFAWVLLGQVPGVVQGVGGVLVVAGVAVLRMGEAPDPASVTAPDPASVTGPPAPRPTVPATPVSPTRRMVRR